MAEPPAIMSQEAACQLAHVVQTTFQRLAKNGKPQPHEYTVLAGIALAYEGSGMLSFQVVALGTGTKCMGGSVRSAKGELLHDSHAEVIARRALMLWMHGDIRLAMQQHEAAAPMPPSTMQHSETPTPQPQHGTSAATTQIMQTDSSDVAVLKPPTSKACALTPSAFVYDPCSGGFKLRPGLKVVMYISQPPCGDASIVVREGVQGVSHHDASQLDQPHTSQGPSTALPTIVDLKPAMASNGIGEACSQLPPSQQPAADAAASAVHQSAKLRTGAKALKLTISEGPGGGEMVLQRPCQAAAGAMEVPPIDTQQALAIKGQEAPVGGIGRGPCGQETEPTWVNQPDNQRQQGQEETEEWPHAAGAGGCRKGSEQQTSVGVGPSVAATVYVPQAGDVEAGQQECGILRRKPGKGDPTLSLSCSDKLARWSCCGLQGALLSGLLTEPVYLTALVVGMQPEVAEAGADVQQAALVAVARGVSGRLVGVTEPALLPPYRLSQPTIHLVAPPPDNLGLGPSTQRRKGSGFSMSWVAAPGCWLVADVGQPQLPLSGTVEVTTAGEGFRAGASKAAVAAGKAQSRLCRAALAREAVRTVGLARAAGFEIPSAAFHEGSGDTGSGQHPHQHPAEQQPQEQPAKQQGAKQLESQCNVSTTRHQPVSLIRHPANNAEAGSTECGVSGLAYLGLKQRLGGAYMAMWRRLRQQQPFRLWIAKPAHLQAFDVGTL